MHGLNIHREILLERLTRFLMYVGAFLLLSILVLTLINIILRASGNGLRGGVEISGYLGAAALGLCLPWVHKNKSHATGGLLYHKLAEPLRSLHDISIPLICLILTFIFTRELYDLSLFIYEGSEVVDGWDIPSVFFVGMLTFACAVQAFVVLIELAQAVMTCLKAFQNFFYNKTKNTMPKLCPEKGEA